MPLTCHTSPVLKRKVKRRAKKAQLTDSAWIERALRYVLDNNIAVG